ncbi:CAIB/BAIF family protein [Oceaniovalibus guishaninsula JLT2003]|uniref:CAIB/BAIF family protein n=1 Tax=Oceaniovalibus guishaninsula JLT2003 TaxID=1231392 RepID=K2I5J1_9RHOB|nr:CoA transferase [Oceaniovalibus guishaninsula]EKE44160.1 CAIB/BAIF family protein [Oceaniovalibus guishaninsula JLT2003]
MAGALDGIRVLDLTRILAGPTCTQLLGDLGADVWKIENPATNGDDTRTWGPPMIAGRDGPLDMSAYFVAANRNKYSVAVDLASAEGQETIRALAAKADVVIENFKPGGLAKYGLDAETMLRRHPGLIYCSISGYGQTGPNREKPGYDLMAQGYGGIMSLTGEPDGAPMKVGVGVADIVCGMYACTGILAALRHRDRTGEGQHVDVGLVDTQMAWLVNEATNYLESGELPVRRGNGHPNIVPYDVFATSDGHVIVAVGNDLQFARFSDFLGLPDLPGDARFATNPARAQNRADLYDRIVPAIRDRTTGEVIAGLERRKVPVGPVNDIGQALGSDQARAREMTVRMDVPGAARGYVTMLGNPLKLSATPVSYRLAPRAFGADTDEILQTVLGREGAKAG